MAPANTLYIITTVVWDFEGENEGPQEPEVYSTKDAANKAAHKLMQRIAHRLNDKREPDYGEVTENVDGEGLYLGNFQGGKQGRINVDMCVYKVPLNKSSTRTKAKGGSDAKHAWVDGNSDGDDGDDGGDDDDDDGEEEDEEEPEPPKTKAKAKPAPKKTKSNSIKAALNPSSRKTIPKGKRNCLVDVKILFTGTFNTMDRVTSIATAKKYGADVVTKLEDTDYIVLGDRAGPKKLQVINELELETITEEEFFDILENGVGKEKRERMDNKRKADEEEEPERPAKAARTTKGRGKRAR